MWGMKDETRVIILTVPPTWEHSGVKTLTLRCRRPHAVQEAPHHSGLVRGLSLRVLTRRGR